MRSLTKQIVEGRVSVDTARAILLARVAALREIFVGRRKRWGRQRLHPDKNVSGAADRVEVERRSHQRSF